MPGPGLNSVRYGCVVGDTAVDELAAVDAHTAGKTPGMPELAATASTASPPLRTTSIPVVISVVTTWTGSGASSGRV